MSKLSQRTIVRMMEALSTVPAVERERFCYEHDIPNWFLIHARSYYNFNWDTILRALRDTRFFFPGNSSFGGNILGAEYLPENEAHATGEALLEKLAAMAASLPDSAAVVNSLQLDGFTLDRERLTLIPLVGTVSIEAEGDVFTALLRKSGTPNVDTVRHHIAEAKGLFVDGRFGPSLGQSRNVLQAIIDDISVETGRNGGHARGLPNDTAGRILYLKEVGFLTPDEHDAFRSAWHTLCAGSHPGIPERDLARIGLILALEFGQMLLLKCASWSKGGYRAFSL